MIFDVIIPLLLIFFAVVIPLVLVLAVFNRSLGLRELLVDALTHIFEWGSRISRDPSTPPVQEEQAEEEIPSDPAPVPNAPRLKKCRSSGDLGIIYREHSEIVDEKLHSTFEPQEKQTTVKVLVDDSLDFISAGIEAIIEDQVTSRFSAAQLPSWNLLARTRYSFQYISWKLTLLWLCGLIFRYVILVPIRVVLFVFGLGLLVVITGIVGHIPNRQVKKFLNRQGMMTSMRIIARAFSSIVRYHNRENRPTGGGICVANHTSPLDVMILGCDNCFAMIGQKQGGILGFIQTTLSRAEHHIWFERSEASDRKAVADRMRAHVHDNDKLPIIIFPEGTCINNTSVMMFKKGSFEIGSTIYPIAMKYDNRLTEAFWNSSQYSYGQYLWTMMTSWAVICDVWYLPPMTREEGEDSIAFARRVKRAIAKQGGLVDLEWDGALKREKVSKKLISLQQKLYFDRLSRTSTIISDMDDSESLEFVMSLPEETRDSLLKDIEEADDEVVLIRKVSAILPVAKELAKTSITVQEPITDKKSD